MPVPTCAVCQTVRSHLTGAVNDVCPLLALLAFMKDACSSLYLRVRRGRQLGRRQWGHHSTLSNSNGRWRPTVHAPQGISAGNSCCYSGMNARSKPWCEGYPGSGYTIQFWVLGNSSFLADRLQKCHDHFPLLPGCASDRWTWDTFFGRSLAVQIVFSVDFTAFLGGIAIGHLIRPWMLKRRC